MNYSIIEETKAEWRELGFFYDRDDDKKYWIIIGSLAGVQKFSDLLCEYSADLRNGQISNHSHFGPYMYLKIMTWESKGVSKENIRGSLEDFKRLSEIVLAKMQDINIGKEIRIGEEYSKDQDYDIVLKIVDDDSDPAKYDVQLWK